jgi:hypothetical protein
MSADRLKDTTTATNLPGTPLDSPTDQPSPSHSSANPQTPGFPQTSALSPPTTISQNKSIHNGSMVADVLALIKRYSRGGAVGTDEEELLTFSLSPADYDLLRDGLRKEGLEDWTDDKLRLDYGSVNQKLDLRMPSAVHCKFVKGLEKSIERQLEALGKQDDYAEVIDKIGCASTTDFKFPRVSERDRKSPDSSFIVDDYPYPHFVLEVGCSRKNDSLQQLAEYYIKNSGGLIHTILTVDIEYCTPAQQRIDKESASEAKYSVFRQHIDLDDNGKPIRRVALPEAENQRFRIGSNDVPAGSLQLKLSDFFPLAELSDANDQNISITHRDLAGLLAKAEKIQRAISPTEKLASRSSQAGSDCRYQHTQVNCRDYCWGREEDEE